MHEADASDRSHLAQSTRQYQKARLGGSSRDGACDSSRASCNSTSREASSTHTSDRTIPRFHSPHFFCIFLMSMFVGAYELLL